MPKNAEVFKVFLSSPGDLSEERAVAARAIRAASDILSEKSIRLDAWKWEDDALSEFGGSAQSFIENQLGDYDIYIGLMGAHFGTPTGEFGSGTEKEFKDALKAKEANSLKRVAFFFKDVVLPMSELTPEKLLQAQRVAEFKALIKPLGLQGFFKDSEALTSAIIKLLCKEFGDYAANLTDQKRPAAKRPLQVSPVFQAEVLQAVDQEVVGRPDVTLDELWIEPDLKMSVINGSTVRTRRVQLEEINKEILGGRSFHIHGAETSGKSSLAKRLFLPLLEAGLVPVILDGRKINSLDLSRMKTRVWSHLMTQYDGLSQTEAREIDQKAIILIIDDFDASPIGARGLITLLDLIRQVYFAVAILTSTSFLFVPLESTNEVSGLGQLWKVQINELGHRKRYYLVEKWLKVQGGAPLSDQAFRSRVEKLRNEVNRILVHHIVPRSPIITLILLRAIDAKQSGDLLQSGYVRYYKFLIDNLILRNLSPTEAEYAYALLPEVARGVFFDGHRRLTPDAVSKIIDAFSKRKALRKDFLYNVLFRLKQIGMFVSDNTEYRFRHDYAFHFFLADYINQDLENASTVKFIKGIFDGDWTRENVTILVFLSFFSNSPVVVDGLIEKLSNSYSGEKEFEFGADSSAGCCQSNRYKSLVAAAREVPRFSSQRAPMRPSPLAGGACSRCG